MQTLSIDNNKYFLTISGKMLFYTHLLIGVLLYLITHPYFPGGNKWIFMVIILLGSLLPDIDERNSKISRQSGIIGSIVGLLTKHRGIFHSVFLAILLFLLITAFWSNYYAWAMLIGYFGHLLGDALTPMGIQVFYPLSRFKLRGPIKTGRILELLFLTGIIFLVVKIILS